MDKFPKECIQESLQSFAFRARDAVYVRSEATCWSNVFGVVDSPVVADGAYCRIIGAAGLLILPQDISEQHYQ